MALGRLFDRVCLAPKNTPRKLPFHREKDGSTVSIELDPSDTNLNSFQTYGVACLRKSKEDIPIILGKKAQAFI